MSQTGQNDQKVNDPYFQYQLRVFPECMFHANSVIPDYICDDYRAR